MKNENFKHCKRIGDTLEKIVTGNVFCCPECGELITEDNTTYNEAHDVMTCPCCKAEFNSDDVEPYSLWDYFSDVCDVEYYANGRGADDYRGVRIMVACGGPNIYIDTKRGRVELHWWTEYADYFLGDDVIEEINEIFEEYWRCQ